MTTPSEEFKFLLIHIANPGPCFIKQCEIEDFFKLYEVNISMKKPIAEDLKEKVKNG